MKIVLIGCGGHAKSIVDTIESQGKYEIAGFVAKENDNDFEYRGYKVIGTDEELPEIYAKGIQKAVVCIGYMGQGTVRQKIYDKIKQIGFELPAIIDPKAVLAKDISVGEGVFVGKCSVINSNARIGKMAIINTGAVIEHDCCVGDYTHVAVNATICGNAKVGNECLIGTGATVVQEIRIGDKAIIGAGSVVIRDVETLHMVVGIPAKVVKVMF